MHEQREPIQMSTAELKTTAAAVAEELQHLPNPAAPLEGTAGGSRHRALPEPLRQRFVGVRAALFQRGIFDPLLVRFDTATVAQASTREIGERLAVIAQALR